MRRIVLFVVLAAALASVAPANARTLSSGRMKFNAPVPCLTACAYWLDNANGVAPGVAFDACRHPFPQGSYSDKVLRAPTGASAVIVKIYPEIDWDVFLCSKPTRGNNGRLLASGANTVDECQIGCVETIRYRVKPGVRYVVRAYNWSDLPDVTGRFWFIG